ncbi:predicted protein [Phaeodactylum tricornutum CCAP 1055/1]|uniref:Peptidase S1 domain-containing protein n=1 Tax=Phaeodactylum tricornutum (strain CCAP 1055/1) TaxID=556484 RepID=B7GBU8_PHATC|nr:predicted protein [Phaeodactylum tricornutum CCAP 1055/1]EEC43990.1 predicted protein [Phaeodactylum tricornutum CCAP 1055/1]|eukprot:XP_002184591.1 predicted protein [Phaeodactylum tricornutum CCAP 1055/1]
MFLALWLFYFTIAVSAEGANRVRRRNVNGAVVANSDEASSVRRHRSDIILDLATTVHTSNFATLDKIPPRKTKDATNDRQLVGWNPADMFQEIQHNPTIVGGGDAEKSDAPWQVMILFWDAANNRWEPTGCAGTLISDRHVLTAGHCAVDNGNRDEGVYVGAYEPFGENPGVPFHFSLIQSHEVHPEFDNRLNDKDAAVLTLTSPVSTSLFPPLQLAGPGFPIRDGDLLKIYGFGRVAEEDASAVETLQVAQVPYISSTRCSRYHSNIRADMFCAGFLDGGVDACQGDSGGPAIRELDGIPYQVGIVSWGVGCARANHPGVYASVAYVHEWIRDTVCASKAVAGFALCAPFGDANPDLHLVPTVTLAPTLAPTVIPTLAPTLLHTLPPTLPPTLAPTLPPTLAPSLPPTQAPALATTVAPTMTPTVTPPRAATVAIPLTRTTAPSLTPTRAPTFTPTPAPALSPPEDATVSTPSAPAVTPTRVPSQRPTVLPLGTTGTSDPNPTRGPATTLFATTGSTTCALPGQSCRDARGCCKGVCLASLAGWTCPVASAERGVSSSSSHKLRVREELVESRKQKKDKHD